MAFLAVLVLVTIVAVTALVAAAGDEDQDRSPRTDVSIPGIAAVGDAAPPFTIADLKGPGQVGFTPGRPTVITFWASWCAPCREEFALLRDARSDHPEVEIIGIVYQDIPADARRFAREADAIWTNGIDENRSVAQAYGVRAIPQTFFVDRDGVVRARIYGFSDRSDLEAQLAKIA